MEVATFTCTICGESSRDICVTCTKDTCANHLCERCKSCSDCCVCEVRLVTHHPANGKISHPVFAEQRELPKDAAVELNAPEEPEQT